MMNKNHKIFKVITIVVVVITLFLAGWIMANKFGLVEGYDFGAGAYFYARGAVEMAREQGLPLADLWKDPSSVQFVPSVSDVRP